MLQEKVHEQMYQKRNIYRTNEISEQVKLNQVSNKSKKLPKHHKMLKRNQIIHISVKLFVFIIIIYFPMLKVT